MKIERALILESDILIDEYNSGGSSRCSWLKDAQGHISIEKKPLRAARIHVINATTSDYIPIAKAHIL